MIGSGRFDGKGNREAYAEIVAWLASEGRGETAINSRLRDWLVSRQRYRDAASPIRSCDAYGMVPEPDEQLPVQKPETADRAPQAQRPLAAGQAGAPSVRQ